MSWIKHLIIAFVGSVLIEGCDNNQKQCISDNIQNVESFIKKEVQYEG